MVDVCDMVSAVQTTCVGAWTEGAVKNWFTEEEDGRRMMGRAWRPQLREETSAVTAARVQAKVKEVVEKQVNLGLDIVTDGEVGRENYFLHFVRNGVVGIDLKVLSDKVSWPDQPGRVTGNSGYERRGLRFKGSYCSRQTGSLTRAMVLQGTSLIHRYRGLGLKDCADII